MTQDARPLAATMTFVLFYEDAGVSTWARERTQALAAKHPSRVLVLDATRPPVHEDAPATPGAWVELGAQGATEHELVARVRAIALPEAPIVLAWIAKGLASDPRFVALAHIATTVVCSTSVIDTGTSGLADLCAFARSHPEIPVQDIAYLRLGAWQDVVASFFDEPQVQGDLQALRRVELAAGSQPEMYYVLGWLASRLCWTPAGPTHLTNDHGAPIDIALACEGVPRRLERIVLTSANARYSAAVHPEDPNAISLQIERPPERIVRYAPLHSLDIASLVERAILMAHRDDVFAASLHAASHLIDVIRLGS